MSTFYARWLRAVVKNKVRPTILYVLLHRRSVNRHFR